MTLSSDVLCVAFAQAGSGGHPRRRPRSRWASRRRRPPPRRGAPRTVSVWKVTPLPYCCLSVFCYLSALPLLSRRDAGCDSSGVQVARLLARTGDVPRGRCGSSRHRPRGPRGLAGGRACALPSASEGGCRRGGAARGLSLLSLNWVTPSGRRGVAAELRGTRSGEHFVASMGTASGPCEPSVVRRAG